jgi:elongation factor G
VPELEIDRYAVDLRSISHGTGQFSRCYARHEAMPQQVAARMRGQSPNGS